MKVRILCRISYDRPAPYDAGEVCDFSAESARYLISHGLAEPVEDKREVVSPAPEPLALASPEATAPEATAIDTSSSEHAVVPPARRRG